MTFVFTWIGSNFMKNDLTVKGAANALTMYNILHNEVKAHGLRCLMQTDNNEAYVVFIDGHMLTI